MTHKRLFAVSLAVLSLGVSPVAVGASQSPIGSHPAASPTAVRVFANCTAMNKVYPHGVGRKGARDKVSGSSTPVRNFYVSTAIYNANTARDRDRDGVACEKR
jgi:hypothetical protein